MKLTPPNPNSVEWPQVNIFVPYTYFYPSTYISLVGFNFQPVKTSGKYGYQKFFQGRWKDKKTFIVVEQDVVVWPGAIKQLWDCPEDICLYDSHLPNQQGRNLSDQKQEIILCCTKISSNVINKFPELWDKPVDWSRCSLRLAECGVKVHQHYPGIVNSNKVILDFLKIK